MTRSRRVLLGIVAFVLLVIVVVLVGGAQMPRDHVARSTIRLAQPIDTVWALVRNFAGEPTWWDDLRSIERIDDADGREAWMLETGTGSFGLAVERVVPPTMLVTRILADQHAAFGGIWTYELSTDGDGTRVTVTEAGYINNLFFRFMANTVFSLYGSMDSYLTSLARHFGSEATPEHIE